MMYDLMEDGETVEAQEAGELDGDVLVDWLKKFIFICFM